MKTMGKMKLWLLLLTVGVVMTACGSAPTAPVAAVAAPVVASVTTAFGAVTGLAGGRASAPITVTAVDANGNPMANQPVSVNVLGSNIALGVILTPTATGATVTGVTNAQGIFTAILTYVAANGVTVTATAGGVAAPAVPTPNPTVTNILLTAVGVAGGTLADGAAVQTITIQVLDAGNNPIANQLLTATAISVQHGITTLSAPTVTTGANGQTSLTISDLSTVDDQVTVSIAGRAINPYIVVSFVGTGTGSNTVPNGNRLTTSISPATVPADGATSVTLTVNAFDTLNNSNAINTRITLVQNLNAIISPAAALTDAYGNAIFTVTDAYAENVQLEARDASGSVVVQTLSFTPYASVLTITSDKTNFIANNVDIATLTIIVKDPYGRGVPNEILSVASSSNTSTTSTLLLTTDPYGRAILTVKDSVTEALKLTLKTRNGGLLTGRIVSQSIDLYAVYATPQIVINPAGPYLADGYTTHIVKIKVNDNLGNAIANQPITLTTTGSAGFSTTSVTTAPQAGITPLTISTDAYGVIDVYVSDVIPELITITATPMAGIAASSTVQFVANDSYTVSLTATPTVAVPNTAIIFTATVKNAVPAVIANAWVQFDAYAGGSRVGRSTALTSATGVATASFSFPQVGIADVYARLVFNPQASTKQAKQQIQTVYATPKIIINPAGPYLADGYTTHIVKIKVNDNLGNAIANQPITLTTTGSAGFSTTSVTTAPQAGITPLTISTDAYGVIDVYVSDVIPELITITATPMAGTAVSSTVQFVADANTISLTATPTVAVPNTAIIFTATVKNAVPAVIANAWVQFDAYAGGSRVGQSTALTSATGVATASFSFAQVGIADVYATLVFNPQASTKQAKQQIQTVYATPQIIINPAGPYLADGYTTHIVKIKVNDNLGNAIANQPITLTTTGSAGFSTTRVTTGPQAGITPLAISTDVYGVIDVYVSDVIPELITITATPMAGIAASSTVQFVSADSYAMQVSFTPTTGVLPDGVSVATVTVIVTDQYSVVVPNAWVQFEALTATATVDVYATLSASSLFTNATGRAVVTLSRTQSGTTALKVSLPRNTSITTQSIPINFAGLVAQKPSKIALTASAFTLKSDGSDQITLTVRAKDTTNVGVAGATVTFTTSSTGGDAGMLSASSAVTDAYGLASVTLSAGTFDRSNRTINVIANIGIITPTPPLPIVVSGSTVAMQAIPSSMIIADPTSKSVVTVTLKDAGSNPVANVQLKGSLVKPVGLAVDIYTLDTYGNMVIMAQFPAASAGGAWSDAYTTNTSGVATYDIYASSGTAGGSVVFTVKALGALASVSLVPATASNIFQILDPLRAPMPSVSLGRGRTIQVQASAQVIQNALQLFNQGLKADPYARVKLSSSSGTWASTGGAVTVDPYIVVTFPTVLPYTTTADFYSDLPGLVNIQADEYIDARTNGTISYVDPITMLPVTHTLQSYTLLMQVNAITPVVVTVTSSSSTVAPSLGGQTKKSTITATVRDANNFAVSNIPVTFSIAKGPGGGEHMAPVTVFTDSGGQAKSSFISGGLPSAQNGIDIYAQVFSNGQTITGNTLMTIGASAVSVSLGTSTIIVSSVDGTSYILPMSALVTDVNGAAISGATVTLHLRPLFYAYGHREGRFTTTNVNTVNAAFNEGVPRYWPGYLLPVYSNLNLNLNFNLNPNNNVAIGFSAEDRNKNQVLDVVTQGFPEDGYTSIVDFKSPKSGGVQNPSTQYGVPFPSCQQILSGNPTAWYCPLKKDGALTPAHSSAGSVPQTAVTDVTGLAPFKLTYQKRYADWLVVEVTATIRNTAGTESISVATIPLVTPPLTTALGVRLLAAYPRSPFGDNP